MQQNLAGRTRHESTFTVRPLHISKKRKINGSLGFSHLIKSFSTLKCHLVCTSGMMCFVVRYKGDWVQASHYAGVLLDESLWSKVNHSIVNIAFQQLGFDNHYNKT